MVTELIMMLIIVLLVISCRLQGLKYGYRIASKNSTVRKHFGNNPIYTVNDSTYIGKLALAKNSPSRMNKFLSLQQCI